VSRRALLIEDGNDARDDEDEDKDDDAGLLLVEGTSSRRPFNSR